MGARPQLPSGLYVSSNDRPSLLMSPLMTASGPRARGFLQPRCPASGRRVLSPESRWTARPSSCLPCRAEPRAFTHCILPASLRDPFSFVCILSVNETALLWPRHWLRMKRLLPSCRGFVGRKAPAPLSVSSVRGKRGPRPPALRGHAWFRE